MITFGLLMVPLIVACALTIALFFLDADLKWKITCLVIVLACVAMRFVLPINVPFIVPMILESVVAIALSIWLKLEYR